MAMMIHHHDAIVRDAPKVPEFNEYPKFMTHPAYHPGDIGTEIRSPGGQSHFVGGTPIRFAPVLVNGADDEEYYAAKGYVSQGKSDAAAFQRAAAAMTPANPAYKPIEYPKWAGGVLVNSAEEEAAALEARRGQLGLAERPEAAPEAPETAAPNPELDVIAAQKLEIEALKSRMEDMQADMRKLLQGANTSRRADVTPSPMNKQQKAWVTRRAREAEKRQRGTSEAAD
jgi:hypothetical protein